MEDRLEKIKKKHYSESVGSELGVGEDDVDWLIEQAEKTQRYEKTLKDIAESNDDSSCNELALKYEVIAEKSLNN